MMTSPEIRKCVVDFRLNVEECWDETTANTQWRDWAPSENTAASHGQCGSTTLLLHEVLTDNFPDEDFCIAAGGLWQLGTDRLDAILDSHMWVDRRSSVYREIDVFDATADQPKQLKLPPQVIGTYDELADQGLLYIPRMHFDTPEAFYGTFDSASARNRTAILHERYYALKDG